MVRQNKSDSHYVNVRTDKKQRVATSSQAALYNPKNKTGLFEALIWVAQLNKKPFNKFECRQHNYRNGFLNEKAGLNKCE